MPRFDGGGDMELTCDIQASWTAAADAVTADSMALATTKASVATGGDTTRTKITVERVH